MTGISWTEHRQALRETQAWVDQYFEPASPATSLRSSQLGQCLKDYPEAWLYSELHAEQVENLITARRETGLQLLPGTGGSGKILVVESEGDLAMGEGTPASGGVIDDTYLPPWDTWFACLREGGLTSHTQFLMSWIPLPLVDAVQAAIDVSATQHLQWLDQAEGNFFQETQKELLQDKPA